MKYEIVFDLYKILNSWHMWDWINIELGHL